MKTIHRGGLWLVMLLVLAAPLWAADRDRDGIADEVVPWQENTGVVKERYQALGGQIELICKPGVGHHPHALDDPTPIVQFILKHTVEAEQPKNAAPGPQ